MKDQILKIAKVKDEKSFYKKFPTEEAFMAKHGKQLKKAAMGRKMVQTQLKQLTDFGNPPIAQDGMNVDFNDELVKVKAKNLGISKDEYLANMQKQQAAPASSGGGMGDILGTVMKFAPQIIGAMAKDGKKIPKALDGGGWATAGVPGLSTATFDSSTGLVNNASGSVSQSDTASLGFGQTAPPAGTDSGLGKAAGVAGMELLGGAGQIISGIQAMEQQKNNIKKQERASKITALTAQAAGTKDVQKRKYIRPEDLLLQPGQMGSPTGVGTNYLAANGAEIQNTYAPNTIYTDLGYEPLNDSNPKQYRHGGNLPVAEFGDYFQNSGQAQVGETVGTAAGAAIGSVVPVIGTAIGGAIGGFLGRVGGNIFGGADDANRLAREKDNTKANEVQAAWSSTLGSGKYNKFMEDGGWVSNDWQPQVIATFGEHRLTDLLKPPHDADMLRSGGHLKEYTPPSAAAMFTGRRDLPYQMAMGGELQVGEGGYAEPISYNPYMPGTGETVMFRGRSHDDGGIPIQYGQNGVEVEGGEPMFQMEEGGQVNNTSGVVAGNMKIDKFAAEQIEDPKAKGKKYKHYVADLSKVENKQNKIIDKSTQLAIESDASSPFDQLSLNSSQANIMGANMKLKETAMKKMNAAAVQNAILDTAKELGVKSDRLAEGKIEKEKDQRMMGKNGKTLKKATGGTKIGEVPQSSLSRYEEAMNDLQNYSTQETPSFSPIGGPSVPEFASLTDQRAQTSDSSINPSFGSKLWGATKAAGKFLGKGIDKYGPTVMSQVAPFLRPTNQEGLDPSQLYPEYLALATNQLEPVQAQTFEPTLLSPYDVSLQDQLNEVDSQVRSATRMLASNPSAAATIFAQAEQAKNRIRGEQFRMNQANKSQIYNQNAEKMDQAKLKNLQILDNQAVNQAKAKSNTKEQALKAIESIAAKTAQNKLENRQLGVYENLYNYRFGPKGQAYSVNDPAKFNMAGNPTNASGQSNIIESQGKKYRPIDYDNKTGVPTKFELIGKNGTKVKARNGSIVKSLKTL
jgi:hypothetical protein